MATENDLCRIVIEELTRTLGQHAEELTELDQAIGDGDHGINMKRGFDAVMADVEKLAGQSWPEALRGIGMTLVMKVGGASGPLYGTLFLTLGKDLPASPAKGDWVRSFGVAVKAVQARGKAELGHKTMLDVLLPISADLEAGMHEPTAIKERAHQYAEATKPLKATKGRASFLGDRSIGHLDPGARSSALMIATICDILERVK